MSKTGWKRMMELCIAAGAVLKKDRQRSIGVEDCNDVSGFVYDGSDGSPVFMLYSSLYKSKGRYVAISRRLPTETGYSDSACGNVFRDVPKFSSPEELELKPVAMGKL